MEFSWNNIDFCCFITDHVRRMSLLRWCPNLQMQSMQQPQTSECMSTFTWFTFQNVHFSDLKWLKGSRGSIPLVKLCRYFWVNYELIWRELDKPKSWWRDVCPYFTRPTEFEQNIDTLNRELHVWDPASSQHLSVSILGSADWDAGWTPETVQMGKPVPYCGSSHPDGKMPHKCQGKPAWLHSTHTLDTQLNNTKEKAVLPYTRVPLLTACWHQEY